MSESIIPPAALSQLVAAYRQSDLEIRLAFALLLAAQKRLRTAFDADQAFDLAAKMQQHRLSFGQAEGLMGEIKKDAWRTLIHRMQLGRVLSVAASKKLSALLETGKDLPGIDEGAVHRVLDDTLARSGEFLAEAVREVFDFLRPPTSRLNPGRDPTTGARAILRSVVEQEFHSARFGIVYDFRPTIRAVDNVFHALDAQGTLETALGPLVDALLASPNGQGETAYFKFKCSRNGNLHLEFKRPDLVAKLNEIAGTRRLRQAAENPPPPAALPAESGDMTTQSMLPPDRAGPPAIS
jgi:hypothetical protein